MSFVQLALGRAKGFALAETLFGATHIGLVLLFSQSFNIEGAAIAFSVLYVLYILGMRLAAGFLTGFQWSSSVRKLGIVSLLLILGCFILAHILPPIWAMGTLGMLSFATAVYCLRALTSRLGSHHRVTRLAGRVPWLVGKPSEVAER